MQHRRCAEHMTRVAEEHCMTSNKHKKKHFFMSWFSCVLCLVPTMKELDPSCRLVTLCLPSLRVPPCIRCHDLRMEMSVECTTGPAGCVLVPSEVAPKNLFSGYFVPLFSDLLWPSVSVKFCQCACPPRLWDSLKVAKPFSSKKKQKKN